jgi:signal transduction histidine kinase/anti-sigma regulatory factor (Ser/Thr protein kinase)
MENENSKIKVLKEKLNKELEKENSDGNLILQLSHQIANLDVNTVRFSIDAGVIDRLGKELVARQETAVSELVKNSYDADAQEVILDFIETDEKGGTLIIADDGDGMTREELLDGFMRISSTGKIHNPKSKKFKRKRAGKKGIGRFAVQRLGKQLTIITQTEEGQNALKLVINWDDYQKDLNLLSISNTLEIIPKTKLKGTELIIENLRDKWTAASIKRIYRYVSDIIQPYTLTEEKLRNDQNRIDETQDPGFFTSFSKTDNGKKSIIADEKSEIFKYSVATFEGWVDNTGQGIYSIISDKLNINELGEIGSDPDNKNAPFDKLRKIKFRAYYFLLDSEFIPKLQNAHIRSFLKSQGSIRLYRNGFRVLPYGEPGDDWLRLDFSLRTRSILPSHGNNNFYGLVEMLDEDDVFTETSSREGLADSEELRQLQNFIYRTLMTGVIKVAEVRNIKITTSQSKDENDKWEATDLRIKNIFETIEELNEELEGDTSEIRRKRKKRIKKIKEDLAVLQELQKSQQAKFIKERSMLRVLSSVGLSIAQFIHEIKYHMVSMKSDVSYLLDNLSKDSESLKRALVLDENFSSFHTYTSYFDDVVSKNVTLELQPLNMEQIISDFINSIGIESKRSGIIFLEPDYPLYRVFTKPMHPSEWSSIFFNFYTNSKKAIDRQIKKGLLANKEGRILIEVGEHDNFVFVEFSDNGDGIPENIEDKIFDEFFTTTSSKGVDDLDSNTEILGTGLGLKIVKDIVKSHRGNIFVVSPKAEFSTTIRIEIPKLTDKERKEYGL